MKRFTSPMKYLESIANQKKAEGDKEFTNYKKLHNLPREKEIADIDCQRLAKIELNKDGIPAFSPYYGLTYMGMLPINIQEQLSQKVDLLKEYLENFGIDKKKFLFVPANSYHITFVGIIERIYPDILQEEVDYYHFKTMQTLAMSTINKSSTEMEVSINEFLFFKNHILFAKPNIQMLPGNIYELRRLESEVTKKKIAELHITLAYFVDVISESETHMLSECLKKSSEDAFQKTLRFNMNDVQMYYFSAMDNYIAIPETNL